MTVQYKDVQHKINWLDNISGLTVTDAIDYLKSLGNDNLILDYSLDGDTQAVWLESSIIERVPMTREERVKEITDYYDRRIRSYNNSYEYAHSVYDYKRIESLDKIVKGLEEKKQSCIENILLELSE